MGKASPFLFMVFMFMSCFLAIATAEYMPYRDPNQPIGRRIRDLMNRMTLEEKIGQMTQIERSVASESVVNNYYIGSILSAAGSPPFMNLKATAMEWVDMVNDYQKASLSTRLGIPMIYGIDALHGHNNAYNATIFPHNVGLGVTRDPELVRRIGDATALEVRATGIPYTFAPCIAVCRDPRWGRCYESYSEDPSIVQAMTEIINGLQGQIPDGSPKGVPFLGGQKKIAATAKHYVGDGGTKDGINEGNTIATWHQLLSIHMPGYYSAIIKGVSSIMISFSSWNGVKMHGNHELITDFLKGRLRFRGFVISDWQGIDQLTNPPGANYTYSVLKGINAGIDMVMVPINYTDFITDLTKLVKGNYVSMTRIDDAVKRILRVKFTMGLFEHPFADYSLIKYLGSQEHRELAREAVRKSLVLLKNGKEGNKPLIPLSIKAQRILVAGTHADNIGYQCGGWTITWQGGSGRITKGSVQTTQFYISITKSLNYNSMVSGTTILEGIRKTVGKSTEVVYKENPSSKYMKDNNFSYSIVVVGEHPYAEGEGDSTNLTISAPGPTIIKNVCESTTCVVVLVTGRPVVIEPYLSQIHGLVAAWLPGSEGQGVADVLFGDYGFTGKLARTWFKRVDQLPMNVGDKDYDPLFPFGFGLTTKPVKMD